MKQYNVIGIGEVLWDMLPNGKELGGAPSNFAFHTKKFGANSTIISSVGSDTLGMEIIEVLNKREQKYIFNSSNYPTGSVLVRLNGGEPKYEILGPVAWDHIILNDQAKKLLAKADAICYGTLAQRSGISRHFIEKALMLVPRQTLKVFDINLRQKYFTKDLIHRSLRFADVLKLNSGELLKLQGFFQLNPDVDFACNQLIEQFSLKVLALTNGSKNSMLFTKNNKSVISTPDVKVVDTVGAGDSFTAALVMGLLKKEPMSKVHQEAVDYAAQVCMNKGATPNIKPC